MTNLETITNEIKTKFESKKVAILYAFNGVGKTRLSGEFENLNKEDKETGEIEYKTLCYSAFVEDLFVWNNEDRILNIVKDSWIHKLIAEHDLESVIELSFKKTIISDLSLEINYESGDIIFFINTEEKESIKISKGEESVFIWIVFFTIINLIIQEIFELDNKKFIDKYNMLRYIILDDPVSSLDDTAIIKQSIDVASLIEYYSKNSIDSKIKQKKKELKEQGFNKKYVEKREPEIDNEFNEKYRDIQLNFLITTHHPLFYNVLHNSIKPKKRHSLILKKIENKLELKSQGDSPFGYHLLVKEEIQKAIDSGEIQKYHFNLFRGLLEKTANFLGKNSWGECIEENETKKEFLRLINLYSHGKLSDIEYKEVSDEDKKLFEEKFNEFITNFKYQ